ncbi:hypothetical protein GGR52DRAFT_461389 [Hypoxylon sp. FL1284]|nr:hypothetical protein GGR52DRAFT_461389 [Hypoxylon sp. FL1284]
MLSVICHLRLAGAVIIFCMLLPYLRLRKTDTVPEMANSQSGRADILIVSFEGWHGQQHPTPRKWKSILYTAILQLLTIGRRESSWRLPLVMCRIRCLRTVG